ncbi:hypothetical protein PFISCL1PPCAC_2192, partial [Pristionchus fissidentatus]
QYFGNLITLSWWDEVWINEAFTSLYQIDAVNGIGTAESIIELRKSLRWKFLQIDALRKSTPLKNEATTEVEARANFDPPKAYKKVVFGMFGKKCGLKWTIPVHLVKLDGTPYKSFMMSESSWLQQENK